jgi:hypothetical protein
VTDKPPDTPSDLPKDAGRRLRQLGRDLFTSDRSVNEFLLIKEVGFQLLTISNVKGPTDSMVARLRDGSSSTLA